MKTPVNKANSPYVVDAATGCWNWSGGLTDRGYAGNVRQGEQYITAYRWFYEQKHGPVPEGLELDHTCRNPRCVNPDHLEPVTHAENVRRGALAKLTVESVGRIRGRLLAGESAAALAREFGVSRGAITFIKSGHNWKGVEPVGVA